MPHNRCDIYDKRPQLCRDYDNQTCVFHEDEPAQHIFKTPTDLEKYLDKRWSRSAVQKKMVKKNKTSKGKLKHYLNIRIDTPTSKHDFENIKWYVSHKDIFIYKNKNKWFLKFLTQCQNKYFDVYQENISLIDPLNDDNQLVFASIEEVEDYLKKRWK